MNDETTPSIAELQRIGCEMRSIIPGQTNDLFRGARAAILLAHATVLLEIAAAALAWNEARDAWMVAPTPPSKTRFTEAATRLAAAVAGKVMP